MYYCIVKKDSLYHVIKMDIETFCFHKLVLDDGYIKRFFLNKKEAIKYCDIENCGV